MSNKDFLEKEPPEALFFQDRDDPQQLKRLDVDKRAWVKAQKILDPENTNARDFLEFMRLDKRTQEKEV